MADRLGQIVDWVPPEGVVADIGTDHGLVPLILYERGTHPKLIAADISAPSLQKLVDVVETRDLGTVIDCRVGDGLDVLKDETVDTIVISGMGGYLVTQILQKGMDVARRAKHLILSPQGDSDVLRRMLEAEGFETMREVVVSDAGKYYEILDVAPVSDGTSASDEVSVLDKTSPSNEKPISKNDKARADVGAKRTKQGEENPLYYKYGRIPLESGDPVLRKKLCCERTRLQAIIDGWGNRGTGSARLEARKVELEAQLKEIQAAIDIIDRV